MRNKKSIFAKSFTRMKQKILERLGYSNRIEHYRQQRQDAIGRTGNSPERQIYCLSH